MTNTAAPTITCPHAAFISALKKVWVTPMQFVYLNSVTASHSSITEIQNILNIKHPSDNNGRIIYTGTMYLRE